MAQEAKVLYCSAFDEVTGSCTEQVWLPAPQLLPPLNTVEVASLLGAVAVLFAVGYAWKFLGRATRD